MKLSLRIIGAVAGLTALAQLGYIFMRLAGQVRGKNSAPVALGMVVTGLVVLIMTWIVAPQLTRVMKPWLHAGHKH